MVSLHIPSSDNFAILLCSMAIGTPKKKTLFYLYHLPQFGHVFLLASHLLCIVLPLRHAQHLFHDKRKTTFWFSLHCYLKVLVFMDALTCAIKFTTPSIWKELSKGIMSHLAPCSLKPHTFKVLTNFLSACAFFTRLNLCQQQYIKPIYSNLYGDKKQYDGGVF